MRPNSDIERFVGDGGCSKGLHLYIMMGSSKERDLSSIFYIIRLKDVDVSRNMEKMEKPSKATRSLTNHIAQNAFCQPIRLLKISFASQSEHSKRLLPANQNASERPRRLIRR